MDTQNLYLFKALDAYPYEIEKAVEALNYALSYEPENVKALCLMAKIQGEQLGDYEAAKEFYERALTSRMDIPEVYPDYIRALLMNDDYKEAQKLIDYAFKVKGIDRGGIFLTQGQLFEALEKYDKAEEALKEAKRFGFNSYFIEYVDEALERIRKKIKVQKSKKRIDEEAEKKAKEKAGSNKNWFQNRLNSLL